MATMPDEKVVDKLKCFLDKKQELEQGLKKLVDDFEEGTGLIVTKVSVESLIHHSRSPSFSECYSSF